MCVCLPYVRVCMCEGVGLSIQQVHNHHRPHTLLSDNPHSFLYFQIVDQMTFNYEDEFEVIYIFPKHVRSKKSIYAL